MAKNIMKLTETYDQIIAVVGDGHINGMKEILQEKGYEVDTTRLHELQKMPKREKDPGSASFHVEYQSS
jgi:pheromone shutdown protein TraB